MLADVFNPSQDFLSLICKCSRFSLIKEHLIEFNQLAMTAAEGSHDMLNRVMTKDNIGLAALFETKEDIWENGKFGCGMLVSYHFRSSLRLFFLQI